MVKLDQKLEERALEAVAVVARFGTVVRAYIFGSQVDGRADEYSDVDVGIFVDGIENWSFEHRVEVAIKVYNEVGDDMEVHFFPAWKVDKFDPAGFAAWVMEHGVRIF